MDSNEKKEEFIVPPREVIATASSTTAGIAIAIAIANENQKSCADCRTTKTPLWRSGPSGPKSLCNACGIRQRKRRAAAAASAAAATTATGSSTSTSESNKAEQKIVKVDGEKNSGKKSKKRGTNVKIGKYDELSVEWRQRLMAFGEGVSLFQKDQRSESPSKKEKKRKRIEGKKKMGEVEQAAVLLMCLSCGSVFA